MIEQRNAAGSRCEQSRPHTPQLLEKIRIDIHCRDTRGKTAKSWEVWQPITGGDRDQKNAATTTVRAENRTGPRGTETPVERRSLFSQILLIRPRLKPPCSPLPTGMLRGLEPRKTSLYLRNPEMMAMTFRREKRFSRRPNSRATHSGQNTYCTRKPTVAKEDWHGRTGSCFAGQFGIGCSAPSPIWACTTPNDAEITASALLELSRLLHEELLTTENTLTLEEERKVDEAWRAWDLEAGIATTGD